MNSYGRGYTAYLNYRLRSDNPHEVESYDWYQWNEGYDDAAKK